MLLAGILLYIARSPGRKAERLFQAGEYAAALEMYRQAGDKKNAARCEEILLQAQYHQARKMISGGSYREALTVLEELGDYQNSARLLEECKFLLAGTLCEAGELDEARELYLALGDYPGCAEALDGLPPLYYEKALALARSFEIEEACRIWEELGDFRNCEILLQRGQRILSRLADTYRTRLNDQSRLVPNSLNGYTYVCEDAYIVTPAKPDENTRFFLYFPGGRDEELNLDFFYAYLTNPAPNTLAVFMRKNGLPDLAAGNRRALEVLEQAATDLGVFVDQPIVAGSSLGVYPAIQCPRFAWRENGIQVNCVLSLDAGNDWWEPLLAPDEEAARELALIGTDLLLFQSPNLGVEHPMIRRFVDAGDSVTVIECVNDEHEQISLDAFSLGFVDWAFGPRNESFMPEYYNFRVLS